MQKNNSFSYFLCALLGLFFIHAQEMQAPKIPDGIKSFLRLHKINVSDRADYSAEEIADLKKMYDARKTTSRGEFDDLETSSVDSDGEDAVTRYRQGTSIREIILTPLKTSASAEERYRQHQTLLNVFQRLQPTFDSTGKDLAPKAHKAQYDSFEEAQPSFVTPQHSAGIDDDLFGFPSTRPPASAPKAGKGIAEVPARTERAPDSSPRLPASRKVTGLSSMPVWGESPRPTVTPTSVAVAAPTPRPRPIVEAKQPVVPSTATPGGPPKPVAGPSEDEKSAILAQVFRESEERKQEETRRAKEAAAARGQAPAASLTFARDEYDDLLEELGANPVTPRTPLKRTTVPPVASSTEPKAPAGPSSDGRTDPKQPVTRPMSFSLTSPALQPSSRPTAPRKDLADTKSTVIATGRRPEDERSQPGTGLSTAAGGLRSFRFTGASDAPVASQGEPTATPTGFARRQGNGLVGPARTTVALGSLKPVLGEDGYSSEEDSPRIFGATPLRPPTSDVPLHNPAQRATGWDPVRDSVTQPNGAVSPTDFDFSEGEVRPKGKGTAALPPPPKGSQRTLAGTPRPTPRALSKLLTAAPSASGPLSPTESLVSRVTTPSSADSPASDGETSEGQVFPPVPRKLSLQPLGPKGLAPAPSTSLGNIPEAGPSGFKPRTLRTPTKASPTGPQAPAAGSFSILTFDGPGGMKPVDTELPSPTGSFSLPSSPTGSQVSASPPASPSSLESGVVREAPKRATKSRSLRVDTSAPLSDGEVTPAPLSTTSSSGDGDLFLGDTPTPGGGSTRGSRSPGEAKEGDSPLSPLEPGEVTSGKPRSRFSFLPGDIAASDAKRGLSPGQVTPASTPDSQVDDDDKTPRESTLFQRPATPPTSAVASGWRAMQPAKPGAKTSFTKARSPSRTLSPASEAAFSREFPALEKGLSVLKKRFHSAQVPGEKPSASSSSSVASTPPASPLTSPASSPRREGARDEPQSGPGSTRPSDNPFARKSTNPFKQASQTPAATPGASDDAATARPMQKAPLPPDFRVNYSLSGPPVSSPKSPGTPAEAQSSPSFTGSPLSSLAGAPSLFGPRKNADLLGGENFSVIAERPFTFSSTQRRASTTADTPPASPTSGVVPPPRAIPKKGTSSTPGAAVRELEAAGGDALTSLTSIPKPPRKSAAESQPRDDGEDTPRTPLTRTPIAPPLPPSESATSSVVLPGASGPLPATPPPSPSVHEEPTVSGSPETDADASRLAAGAAVVLRKTTPKGSPQDRDTVGARPEDDGAGATLVGRGFLPTSLPRSSSGPSTTFRPFEAPPPPDAPKAATRTAADSPGPLRGPSGPEALRGSGDSGRWFLGGGSPSLPGSGDVSARSSLSFGSELPQDTDATIKFGRRRGQPAKGPSTSPVARKFASLREQPQPVSPRRPVTPVRTVDPSRVRKKANPNARPTIMPTSALPWLSKDYAPRRTPSAASSVGRVPPLKGEPFSKPSTDVRTSTTPAGGGPGSPTALPTATSTPLRDGKSKPGGKRDDRESVVVVSEGSGGPAPRSPFVEVPPGAKSRVDGVRPRPDRAPASMQFFRAARRDSIASTLTFGSGSTDSLPEGRRSSPRETALIIPPERVRRAFTAKAEPQKPSAPGGWVTTISAPVSRKQKLTPEQRKRIQQIREEGEMRSYEILQSMRAGKVPAGADTKVAPVAQAPEPTPAESEKASLQARIKAVAQKLAVDDDTLDVTAERSGTRPEEVVFKYSRREVLVDQLKALQGSYARKFGDDDFIADSQAFASQHEIKAKIVKQQEIKERLGLNQRKLGDIAARRIEQKRTFKDTSHDSAAARKPAPVAHKAQPARPVRAG